ncbi:MAG: exodeoxyribonuclease VII small subunit [Firmicutes bacterium]|nr:exodeoxyribonuclease VII small subunit [Bacillota bacterium]
MGDEQPIENYEQIVARLEEIVRLLEAGQAPLADSLNLYQEAQKLSSQANQLLERAETMVQEAAHPVSGEK